MADERFILKPCASAVNQKTNGQSLRRCFSDKSYSNGKLRSVDITSLKMFNKDKENVYVRHSLIDTMPMDRNSPELVICQDKDEENESDAEELTFDKNNNEGSGESVKRKPCDDRNSTSTSPTWNLTVLCNAASPEIRRMQLERDNAFATDSRSSSSSLPAMQMPSPTEDGIHDCYEVISSQESVMEMFTSRKDKSLGRLCDR